MQAFIDSLHDYKGANVYNPWADYDERIDVVGAAQIRRDNLRAYLEPRWGKAKYIIVAEAIGYQGGRFTGIAITCERMLLGFHKSISVEHVFGGDYEPKRTSRATSEWLMNQKVRDCGFNEPTDTVVWESILEANLDPSEVLLWNMFPFHPHKTNQPLSNRTPSPAELDAGFMYTKAMLDAHLGAHLLAVGKKAAETMTHYGMEATALRHPANGGANLYRQQFRDFVKKI